MSFLSLAAIACQEKKAPTTAAAETPQETQEKAAPTLTYSNLVDTPTQEKVQQALIAAGISEAHAAAFLESVPKYDEVAIQSDWMSKYPAFQGYNCRLTSFTLLRDLISFPTGKKFDNKAEDEVLFIDRESLRNAPKKLFTPAEENDFFALFTEVPTTNTKDINLHLQAMQKAWQARGIAFRYANDPTKASLISVVFHSQLTPEENMIFVGHVGVLLPFEGKLLFIEKLAFQEPYQAILFANRTELSDYLMNRYDVEWEQPNAIPFIMENDQLMDGYRPNPYKVGANSNSPSL